jgi:hypothetical protein
VRALALLQTDLLLACSLIFATAATVFPPPRLRRAAQDRAALFGADVAPPRSAQANSRPLNWRLRELSTSKIEHFDRQVEEGFRRQATLLHDTPQPRRAPGAKETSKFSG